MSKLNFNEVEQHLMLKSLQFQRDELQKQLDGINALISKCKGEDTSDPKVIGVLKRTRSSTSDNQISERMVSILGRSNQHLTSRQILEEIKKIHPDVKELDKTEERKYMANLSARLTKGVTDGEIDRIKHEGKDAIYGIKKGQPKVAQL